MTLETLSSTIYFLLAALFVLGVFGILDRKNLMKKLMALNIMQVTVIAFFLVTAQKLNANVPIFMAELPHAESYANPLTHALMLTAIVVGLSITGVALALLVKIKNSYKDLEEDEVMRRMVE